MKTLSHRPTASLVALALTALPFVAGCGADANTTAADAAVSPGADLNGTWRTVCHPTPVGFAMTSLTYTNLNLEGTYTEYSDNACTQPVHVSRWTGTTTVSGAPRNGATPIDIAFVTFTSTALTDANAMQNNAYQYCGLTDWRANVERNVLGAMCQGFSIPMGARSLDIYRVEGSSLRFGQNAQIAVNPAESTRPATIDDMRVFTRR
jgi:hypothetical protein